MIAFVCPNTTCGKRYTVSDDKLGKKAKCKDCGTVVLVKQPEQPEWVDEESTSAVNQTESAASNIFSRAANSVNLRHVRSALVVALGLAITAALFHKTIWRLLPYPPVQEAESRLSTNLPQGHRGFKLEEYRREQRYFRFFVTYGQQGNKETDYEVSYFWDGKGEPSVKIVAYQLSNPTDQAPSTMGAARLLVFSGMYSDTGVLTYENPKLSPLEEATEPRRQAARIAEAVVKSF